MIKDTEKIYYVYNHIRLDTNEIFYVGIGTKNKNAKCFSKQYVRANFKSFSKRSEFWRNVYNKCNKKIKIIIVLESSNLDEIKNKEIELIKLYGKRIDGTGPLVNITDGGDGSHGAYWNDERKISKSKNSIGKKNPFYGKHHNEETINYLREINTGIHDGPNNNFYNKTHNDKTRKIISDLGKKRAELGTLPKLPIMHGKDNPSSKKIIAINHNNGIKYYIHGAIRLFCKKYNLSYDLYKKFRDKGKCYITGRCKNELTLNTIDWEFFYTDKNVTDLDKDYIIF